jgi:histidine ammonia-lyase
MFFILFSFSSSSSSIYSYSLVQMNSATDNPMIFTNPGRTLSGGNFHGEYPAKAMDYLAIGIHEISNMSEVFYYYIFLH